MGLLRRTVVRAVALAALAGCTATTAASNGGVPIDQGSSPPSVTDSTLPPDVTAALAPPDTTDSLVGAVGDLLLGDQAAIPRPVGDDGRRPDVTDDRVLLLGDSIMEAGGPSNYDTIRAALQPLGWRPTIDAVKGRTTAEGLQALKKRRRDVHDVVVVLLGHNDPVDTVAYREKLDAIVEELAGVPRIVFLTNYEFEKGRDTMNDQLRVVDALNDNVEVADWNAVAGHTRGAIGPDGLHLTELGARALAATIAVTLGTAPDGPAGTGPPATGS